MNELNLLVVEDDNDFRVSYDREIKFRNKDTQDCHINVFFAKDEKAAEKLLENNTIDAAIIDLKLGSTDIEYSGKRIIDLIKANLRFPSFVLTGNPEQIEEHRGSQNVLFKVKVKGNEDATFTKLLDELIKIHLTGITKILGKTGQIDKYLNKIFWDHLSYSIDNWINDNSRNSEEKQKSLLRYTLMHMQEYIDEDVEKYHPSEFYITTPIKRNIFTGDIVSFDGNRFIVLTPSCDIVIRQDGTRNTKKILFCKIKKLNEEIKNYDKLNIDTGNNNDDKKRLVRYIGNNSSQNFHFIPKNNLFEAGLIDFQDKITMDESQVTKFIEKGEMKREATVSMPFLKDIISRYSNYYARQGSPDFDSEEIYKTLFN